MTSARLARAPAEDTHVVFDGGAITVTSDVESVHEKIRRDFAQMIGAGDAPALATISLHSSGASYDLEGPSFRAIRHVDLDALIVLLKEELRLEFMRQRPDLLWMHAGGVEANGRCMLILGASGQGKSTLSTLLCRRGWHLLSDDVVPIAMDADVAFPFPQTPFRRLPSADDWDEFQLGAAMRERMELSESMVIRFPVPVSELVFPFYRRGAATDVARLTKGEGALEMLRSSTNFCDHKERAVERAARMAKTLPAWRLTYGDGNDAAIRLAGLRDG